MSDVFISYSRVDKEFVRKLCHDLEAKGHEVWVDWQDIPLTAEWMQEIYAGIESANAFVVVLSPDSIISPVCAQELTHALKNNKRLIPLIYRDVNIQSVPKPLADLNWIFMRQIDDYGSNLLNLVKSLDIDLDWVRLHTRLQVRAIEWEHKKRNTSILLRGDDLKEAENWRQRAMSKDPQPTLLQREFIQKSRETEIKRRRILLSAISVGIFIVLVFGAVAAFAALYGQNRQALASTESASRATQEAIAATERAGQATQKAIAGTESANRATQVALTEREARINQARKLVEASQIDLEKYPQRSMLLAIAALQVNQRAGEAPLPLAIGNLMQSLSKSGGRGFAGQTGEVFAVAISPDYRWLAVGGADSTVRLWDLSDPDRSTKPFILGGHSGPVTALVFSPDGFWLASTSGNRLWNETYQSTGGETFLWDLAAADPSQAFFNLTTPGERVNTLGISPDGHWLVTAGTDNTARLWDLTASVPSALNLILKGHREWIWVFAFSQDSQWLATGSSDDTARLWNLQQPLSEPRMWNFNEDVNSLAISPDGHWLATGLVSGAIHLLDLNVPATSGTALILTGHQGPILSLTFSPDSQTIISGSADRSVRLWNLNAVDPSTSAKVLTGPNGPIRAFSFSPGGFWLAAAGGKELFCGGSLFACNEDNTIWFWDLNKPDPSSVSLVLFGHESYVESLAASQDGRWLFSGSADGTARLWDTQALFALPIVLRGHFMIGINDVAVSEDNRWLATAGDDNTVRLWDLNDPYPGRSPIVLDGHDFGVNAVAFSPNNHWLVSVDGDNIGRLWDLSTIPNLTEPILLLGHERDEGSSSGGIRSMDISQDSHWLATGSSDSTVRLWDLSVPDPGSQPIVFDEFERGVTSVAISPDNHWLAAGSFDNTVRLWDLSKTLQPQEVLSLGNSLAGTNGINDLCISNNSRWLAAASDDGNAYLWNLTASDPAARVVVLSGHDGPVSALAFSRDNRWLVTAGWDTTSRLWDLSAPDPSKTEIILGGHTAPVLTVAMSKDNHWLATGDEDGVALLWDLTDIQTIHEPIILGGHVARVNALTFSPNGRWLITVSLDDTVHIWPLEPDTLIALACRTAGRNLSKDELDTHLDGEKSLQPCE